MSLQSCNHQHQLKVLPSNSLKPINRNQILLIAKLITAKVYLSLVRTSLLVVGDCSSMLSARTPDGGDWLRRGNIYFLGNN